MVGVYFGLNPSDIDLSADPCSATSVRTEWYNLTAPTVLGVPTPTQLLLSPAVDQTGGPSVSMGRVYVHYERDMSVIFKFSTNVEVPVDVTSFQPSTALPR
jgi:hypothetical protein